MQHAERVDSGSRISSRWRARALALLLGTSIAGILLVGVVFGPSVVTVFQPDPIPDTTFHRSGRVLDRETLAPIGGAKLVRLDGQVTVVSEANGRFSFPIRNRDLGHCRKYWNMIACSFSDRLKTCFTVQAEGFEPLEVDGGLVRCDDDFADVRLTRVAKASGR
jgi:hypothetical protein